MSTEILYGVFRKGGFIGEGEPKAYSTSTDKEEMKVVAKRLRKNLSRGERSHYKISYVVRQLKKEDKILG